MMLLNNLKLYISYDQGQSHGQGHIWRKKTLN